MASSPGSRRYPRSCAARSPGTRAKEMAQHAEISTALDLPVFLEKSGPAQAPPVWCDGRNWPPPDDAPSADGGADGGRRGGGAKSPSRPTQVPLRRARGRRNADIEASSAGDLSVYLLVWCPGGWQGGVSARHWSGRGDAVDADPDPLTVTPRLHPPAIDQGRDDVHSSA